jgi:hypothetical protein
MVFRVVMPCNSVVGYHHFAEPSYLHLQHGDGEIIYSSDRLIPTIADSNTDLFAKLICEM